MKFLTKDEVNGSDILVNIMKAPVHKRRFMEGFHEFLKEYIDDDCDYELFQVVDLGDRVGDCDYCGTAIRYEYWVRVKSSRKEFKLGSTCITKVDFLAKHINVSNKDFLRILNKEAKIYKDKYKREDNRERYSKYVDFIERYIKIKHEWKLRSVIIKINKGRTLTNDDIKVVEGFMNDVDIDKMEKEHEEFIKRNKVEHEERVHDSVNKRKEYEEIIVKTLELEKYVASPFILDMARKIRVINDGDVLFELPNLLTDNQLDTLKRILDDYDLGELEFQREQNRELIEGQKFMLDEIISRFESGEIDDFEMKGNGNRRGASTYKGMFKSIRERLNKRPLSEGEQRVVDKFNSKYGKVVMCSKPYSEDEAAGDEKSEVVDIGKIKKILDF